MAEIKKSCQKVFKNKDTLRIHVNDIHSELHKCDVCDMHKKKSMIKCEICGIEVASKNALNSHNSIVHIGLKKWQCKMCDKVSIRNKCLNDHVA